ncbi:MAG: Bor family protein [Anaeromyxobacteraceae bacterium]|nr:Bor family protein [Anaeromyxobacteraceae bacterium]
MPPSRRLAFAAAAALALAGCQTIRYETGRPASPRHVEQQVHFWFWGLSGRPVIDLDAACPEGVARWRSEARAGDWLVDVLTLGIYNPRTITVECAEVSR